MVSKQLSFWDENYYNSLVIPELLWKTKDLTTRVSLDYKFKSLRIPLDFNEMANLIGDKYSNFKVPKALLKTLSEYHKKEIEDVDFVDLTQMYYSINSVFDGDVDKLKLKKWRDVNKLSFFGPEQYYLMESYFKKKMGLD